ncbi:MAG: YkgJ family cysteine cluster protein [Bacteroidota bacterium]|nr:YkgJ family cysteine cluster protein [Bacteroidota bacterium]MDP4205127.1 YkgJ family cysteine cluster protein [Bacteroidota bacterium]
MEESALKHIKEYFSLRLEIEKLCEHLTSTHQKHLKCKEGCDLCCLDFDVFPIEYYAIREEIRKQEITLPSEAQGGRCSFLKNHSCSLYNLRPIICRTHGLPLLNMNEEGTQWELSFCELNFKDTNENDFDENNTYPQDTFNSRLFMLNRDFISSFDEKSYNEFDLIPLKNLLKE